MQAQANGVRVAALKDLPATNNTGQDVQQQQFSAQLMHLAGLNMPGSNGTQESQVPAPLAAAAVGLVPVKHHQWAVSAAVQLPPDVHHQQHAASSSQQGPESPEASALRHITSLRLGLTSTVTAIFKSVYDELWLDVVSSKPP